MPHRRNPNAALSPVELNALQRARDGFWQLVSKDHQALFQSMNLESTTESGQVVLTDQSQVRLFSKSSTAPTNALTINPTDRLSS